MFFFWGGGGCHVLDLYPLFANSFFFTKYNQYFNLSGINFEACGNCIFCIERLRVGLVFNLSGEDDLCSCNSPLTLQINFLLHQIFGID